MYEIDFLPVGDGESSGDAIALRFTRPDSGKPAHVIIDAGYADDGEALVEHVRGYYETEEVDLMILTHPDADHYGGMATVLESLTVGTLLVHDLGARGGGEISGADAVRELIVLAESRSTTVFEPFAGATFLGGAITVLGPTVAYYDDLIKEQLAAASAGDAASSSSWGRTAVALAQRVLAALPFEIRFDDAGGTSACNNSSMITMLNLPAFRAMFTGDAGVRALERAWDTAELLGLADRAPEFVQVAHHGSRHNASSDTLDRLFGPVGQERNRAAFVSVSRDAPDHPSPRVVNGVMRRGYHVFVTAGQTICSRGDGAPQRSGWSPLEPLAPLDETTED